MVRLGRDTLAIDGYDTVPLAMLRRVDARGLTFERTDLTGWRLGFDRDPPAPLLWQISPAARYGGWIDRVGLWRTAGIGVALSALVVLAMIYGTELVARLIPYRWEQKLGDAISGDFGDQACHSAAG